MRVVFLLSQVVIAMTVVVSTILESSLGSGVLLRATTSSHGTATLTSLMAVLTGASPSTATTIRTLVPPFAALKIQM